MKIDAQIAEFDNSNDRDMLKPIAQENVGNRPDNNGQQFRLPPPPPTGRGQNTNKPHDKVRRHLKF